ncbi:MAG: hypothetical protein AMXMBFR34_30160 [Myxococcaceae bacterium]
MGRPHLITVRAKTSQALQVEAARRRLTQDSGCDRLLVVYGPKGARMYVEGFAQPAPSPARGRLTVREVR